MKARLIEQASVLGLRLPSVIGSEIKRLFGEQFVGNSLGSPATEKG